MGERVPRGLLVVCKLRVRESVGRRARVRVGVRVRVRVRVSEKDSGSRISSHFLWLRVKGEG
jgi:hypothetical protein